MMIRNTTDCFGTRTCKIRPNKTESFFQKSCQEMKVGRGLWLWLGYEVAIPAEKITMSTSKRGKGGEAKLQDVYCFLWQWKFFYKFNPLGQNVYQQLPSPMAFEERRQETTSWYGAQSELTSASCLASLHGFVSRTEHDGALHSTPT